MSSPQLNDVKPDTPLRLGIAARLAFPDGSMKASGLRCEAAKGRLATMRIAGKTYTTLADVKRMIDLCRQNPSPQDSTCVPAQDENQNGSFSITEKKSILAQALNSAAKLKKRSQTTSRTNDESSLARIIPPDPDSRRTS
jgi:DNA-binding transcriptional MerR regulator